MPYPSNRLGFFLFLKKEMFYLNRFKDQVILRLEEKIKVRACFSMRFFIPCVAEKKIVD